MQNYVLQVEPLSPIICGDTPRHDISILQDPISTPLFDWNIIISPRGSIWHDARSLPTYAPRDGLPYYVPILGMHLLLEKLFPFPLEEVNSLSCGPLSCSLAPRHPGAS